MIPVRKRVETAAIWKADEIISAFFSPYFAGMENSLFVLSNL
jgi:hypothetical protein